MNSHIAFPSLLLLALTGLTLAAAPQPLTVAVLPFEATEDALHSKATEAATRVSAQLSTNPNIWTVERAEIDKLLSEQALKLSGLADPATAARIGSVIGAKVLVTGRLIRSGDAIMVVAKVMSTESSRVFGESVTAASLDALAKPTEELAGKITKLLAKQKTVFNPVVEEPEARLARLRRLVGAPPRPSVQVSVKEQDIRRTIIDPAVETEWKKSLTELGFTVIEPSEGGKPADVSITGEAISESGARRGQLISSRARIEVKIVRRSDGKLLGADRETGVGVDIAEAIAGKTALQNSAMSLLERILPKVVAK